MVTIKQSFRAVSVMLLVLSAVFISSLFAMYNANLSVARDIVELQIDNADLLTQIDGKTSMGNMILTLSMISLGITSMVALMMYISRNISENQASMGVLKAMGYRNGQIARSYALFGLPVLTGAVLGFVISFLAEPYYESLLNADLALPDFERKFLVIILIASIIAPAIFFSVFAVLTATIKLRRPPLMMIKENVSQKTGFLARRYSKRKTNRPFLKELSSTVVRSNLVLLFFVTFAGFAFSCQLQLGFSVSSMTDKTLERTLEGVGYESNVRFIQYAEMEANDEQLPYTAVYGEILLGGDTLTNGELVVFQSNNNVFKLLDEDSKKEIDLKELDGVVVNSWLRTKYDLTIGDFVTLNSNGKIFTLPIAAFERSAFGETIYCGYDYAEKYGILEYNEYNGLYTTDTVNFDPSKHIFVSTIENMRDEFQTQKETYSSLSMLFFVLAVLLGIITLQIALRVVVNANRKYLAMMKAYGYSESECSHTVLGKYRPVAYVGFLIGIGYAYGILTIVFGMMAKTSNMFVPVTIDIRTLLIVLLLFGISYELMAFIYKRRISGISLKEIMID